MRHPNTTLRLMSYFAIGAMLILLFAGLRDATWEGREVLRTIYIVTAPAIALFVGLVALVRYYARPSNTFLFIGTGFLGAAILIVYQGAITTSSLGVQMPENFRDTVAPWCWFSARLVLSISLFLSWWFWRRERVLGERGLIRKAWTVYLGVGGVTLLAGVICTTGLLPPVYHPGMFPPRPQEFIPAVFFLLALVGYLTKLQWRTDPFEYWIVLFLIIAFINQSAYLAASRATFDPMTNLARLLASLSYLCVLTGLMVCMYQLFLQAERSAEEMARINTSLQGQIVERQRVEGELRHLAGTLEQRVAERTGELEGSRRAALNIAEDAQELRRRAEQTAQSLRESEAKFRTIIESSPLGTFLCTADGRNVYSNIRMEHALGMSAEAALGEGWEQALHPDDRARIRESWARTVKNQAPFAEVYRFVHSDETVVWVSTKVAPVISAGELLGYVGKVEDITERRRSEEHLRQVHTALERKYEEMEEFLSIIAHDLKHPVVGVQGLLSLIKEDAGERLDPDSRQNLDLSLGECERMKEMLAHLSHLGRIEGVKPRREEVRVDQLVRSSVERFRPQIQKRQIEVQIEAPPFAAVIARGHIEEALTNLIDNALKYACADIENPLRVGCRVIDGWCEIWVNDHGPGIDPRFHQRIFQPFRRLSPPNGVSGSGMGLTAVRRLMQRIGGTVLLDSQIGQGARFTLRFPLEYEVP